MGGEKLGEAQLSGIKLPDHLEGDRVDLRMRLLSRCMVFRPILLTWLGAP